MSSHTVAVGITFVMLALAICGGCGTTAARRESDREPSPRPAAARAQPKARAAPAAPPAGAAAAEPAGAPARTYAEPIASALAEARAQGKRVLVVFSASWCPTCRAMDENVYPDPSVAALLDAGYVMAKVDIDEHRAMALDMGVRSIPDARILDAEGEPIERFVGYRAAEDVAAILSAARPAAGQ